MEFKVDGKELAAVLIVFIAAFGAMQLSPKSTLPDFSAAIQLHSAIDDKAAPIHMQAAAAAEQAYSSILGISPSSPDTIVSFLLLFPPLLLGISAALLYLSLRSLGFRRTVSAFGPLLFSFSLACLPFLPGAYGPVQLAAPLFALFLFCFCAFASGRNAVFAALAALFAAIAAYASPPFGVAAAAVILSFAAAEYGGKSKRLVQFAVPLIAAAAGTFLSQGSPLQFSPLSAQSIPVLLPFIIAPACCAAVLFFSARESVKDFLMFLLGIIAAVFSPVAGGMVLSVAATAGMARAFEQKASRPLMLACAFFITFFSVAGLAMIAGAGAYPALVAATMVSVLSPLLLHFYDYKAQQLFSAAALGLVALSLFLLAFYSIPPGKQFYPQYADRDLSASLSFLSEKGVQQLGMVGGQYAASFYLPSAAQAGISDYFASGKGLPGSGTYLVLSLYDVDGWQGEGIGSYRFAMNFTSSQGAAAAFASDSGMMLAREIAQDGTLALQDGTRLDPSGRAYATAPLSRMVLLRPDLPFYSAQNRVILLEEGASLPYFVKIFSGQSGGLEKVSEFGQVSVFRVK